MIDPINSMKTEMLRRRFSIRTIETYCYHVDKFLSWYNGDLKKLGKKDINEFMNFIMDKHYAGNTINIYWNSLKFFIEEIMHKIWLFKIRYAKKPKSLPVCLAKEEVAKLIDAVKNPKHRLMVSLMYSAGLRVGELVRLKVNDIEFSKNIGWVREGKGNKDRMFIIAERIKDKLVSFIQDSSLKGDCWLFRGNNESHVSIRAVQEIIKKARKRAGILKSVHPHTLRHSFATHLIEEGGDIISVKELLGHSRIETTMVYVHTANPRMINVRSPFDSI